MNRVKEVLELDPQVGDSHLHAINIKHKEITELLLETLSRSGEPNAEFKGVQSSSAFEPFITPMIAAGMAGDLEIIQLLRSRNHKLEKPHVAYCESY